MTSNARAALGAIALLLPVIAPAQISPTAERFTLHGSLNAGMAASSNLPVIGIPKTGTADYRIVTLQMRYKVSDEDQFVIQLLNRRVGTSPLRSAIGDLTTQWAYWQRPVGPLTVKLGRAPLPRGLMNEVRYIGTLQPFFRVPYEFTYDAFDAVDGVVASYRSDFADGWALEGHGFFGGTENRNVRSEATGLSVRISSANRFRGAQAYLETPFGGKFGAYVDRYDRIDQTSGQIGLRNHHALSGQIDQDHFTVRAEHMRETGQLSSSDLRNSYVDLIVKLGDHWRVAGEHSIGDQLVFNTGYQAVKVPAVRSTGAALNYMLSPNTVVKVEHHWRTGYQYDAFVPPTTVTGGAVVVQPAKSTNYWIASIALSF